MAKMMPPHFCHSPLKVVPISAISVKIINLADSQNTNLQNFFTEDKAKTVSNKVNARHEINSHTTQKNLIKDLEVNSYKDAMLKDPDSKKNLVPMEEWSILSDHVKYVTHGESEAFQKLSIDSMNYRQNRDLYKRLNNEQVIKTSLNFGKSPEKLKADYLDIYKGIYVEVIRTDRFDEDTDLRTTYLGQLDMASNTEV